MRVYLVQSRLCTSERTICSGNPCCRFNAGLVHQDQHAAQFRGLLRVDAACVAVPEQQFNALLAESLDHPAV
jgi:hypothetical protein